MRMLESLQQVEFLSHPVSFHQLLVDVFDSDGTFGAVVVAALDDGETAPNEEKRVRLLFSDDDLNEILSVQSHPSVKVSKTERFSVQTEKNTRSYKEQIREELGFVLHLTHRK